MIDVSALSIEEAWRAVIASNAEIGRKTVAECAAGFGDAESIGHNFHRCRACGGIFFNAISAARNDDPN